jgi:hypothetical protein
MGMILLTWDKKKAATHERRIIKKPHPALLSPMRPLETLTSTFTELATERY